MSDTGQPAPDIAVVLNRDLMFGSRIRGALKALGLDARVVGDSKGFFDALQELSARTAIGIIDMNGAVDWEAVGAAVERWPAIPMLAFGSHKDVENLRAAKVAGVTRVVSNGQFHREMADLIERYGRM